MNNIHLQHAKHVRGITPAFSVPEQGRSMEEFKVMVAKFMENKLGPGDHAAIVDRAMDLADVNKDSKVGFNPYLCNSRAYCSSHSGMNKMATILQMTVLYVFR